MMVAIKGKVIDLAGAERPPVHESKPKPVAKRKKADEPEQPTEGAVAEQAVADVEEG